MDHVFTSSNIEAVDMPFPDGSAGKCIVITDKRSGDTWRFPFPIDAAKALASQLNADAVVRPSALEQAAILGKNGKKLH